MSLTEQQKHLIITVDKRVKSILAKGGNEAKLLVEMFDIMPRIKAMIDSAPTKEIEMYFYEYDGFCRYIKLLENLAPGIADGRIKVPN